MLFNEPTEKRRLYATWLWLTPKYSNTNIITNADKKQHNKISFETVTIVAIAFILGYYIYRKFLPAIPYIASRTDVITREVIIAFVYILVFVIAYSTGKIIMRKQLHNLPQLAKDLVEVSTGKLTPTYAQTDKHLLSEDYVILTYTSESERIANQAEIDTAVQQFRDKWIVVYTLPYRIPYMVRLDNYIFCFSFENKKLHLLGIARDNHDHTALARLAQTHKLGPLMSGETIQ